MIALVALTRAGSDPGFIEIDALPRPPALKYSGFLIQCSPAPNGLIEWILEMRSTRPHLPIGGVVDPGDPFLFELAASGVQLNHLLRADEIADGCIPTEVLDQFRDDTVDGLVRDALVSELMAEGYDITSEVERILRAVAAVGSRGAGVPSLVTCLGLSRTGVYRLFQDLGLPPPGEALRRVRHMALRIRVQKFGLDEAVAREAVGWLSPRAYENARYRLAALGTGSAWDKPVGE
jgi:hypothetical protein